MPSAPMALGLYRDALDEEVAYLLVAGGARSWRLPRTRSRSTSCSSIADRVPAPAAHHLFRSARHAQICRCRGCCPPNELARRGREHAASEPELYDRLVDATQGDAVAILCTTSGTTSHPKLAMLSAGTPAAPLRCLSGVRSEGAGRRIRLGAAAALDHGAGLRARQSAALPDEGQFRRGARHDDARFPRDRARPSCCSRRACGRRSPPMSARG